MLAQEKLTLYSRLRDEGLGEEAAVALISGAVVSVHPDGNPPSRRRSDAQDAAAIQLLNDELEEGRGAKGTSPIDDPLADSGENPLAPDEPGP